MIIFDSADNGRAFVIGLSYFESAATIRQQYLIYCFNKNLFGMVLGFGS